MKFNKFTIGSFTTGAVVATGLAITGALNVAPHTQQANISTDKPGAAPAVQISPVDTPTQEPAITVDEPTQPAAAQQAESNGQPNEDQTPEADPTPTPTATPSEEPDLLFKVNVGHPVPLSKH